MFCGEEIHKYIGLNSEQQNRKEKLLVYILNEALPEDIS